MADRKLISFVIRSQMGLFKKPDINEVYLSYNMLHKPALLGILGAIIGLSGFGHKEDSEISFPEYYLQLRHIPLGIEPLRHEKGVFQKAMISYTNTTGFANQGEDKGGATHLITEQTLIDPAYKVFLLLDMENEVEQKLYHNIKKQQAVFLPYMGKNDYSLWWDRDEVKEHEFQENFSYGNSKKIITIFSKSLSVQKSKIDDEGNNSFDFFGEVEEAFVCFEKLPTHYNEELRQYHLEDFAYTNIELKPDAKVKNLFFLHKEKRYVQLN